MTDEQNPVRRSKLKRLRDELAKGEADLAAGRSTALTNEDEIREHFARL